MERYTLRIADGDGPLRTVAYGVSPRLYVLATQSKRYAWADDACRTVAYVATDRDRTYVWTYYYPEAN